MTIANAPRLLAVLGLAAALAIAPGCIVVVGNRTAERWADDTRYERTITLAIPHVEGSKTDVESRNGAIEIKRAENPAQPPEVAIRATFRMSTQERLDAATVTAERDAAGTLLVRAVPPTGGWRSGEGCSFIITTPTAGPVKLTTSNGRITANSMVGLAELDTSNGAIRVDDHQGEIRAQTSNGRVELVRVAGPIKANTSNGAITVDQAAPTHPATPSAPIDLRTSNGSIQLTLVPQFTGAMEARTSNGRVTLPDAGPQGANWSIKQLSNTRGEITVGAGGPQSTLRSSNGSITVRFAP